MVSDYYEDGRELKARCPILKIIGGFLSDASLMMSHRSVSG